MCNIKDMPSLNNIFYALWPCKYISDQHGKRKRRTPQVYVPEDSNLRSLEQKILQQAIVNSRKETTRMQIEIPEAPVFYPTVDEFKNPLGYIAR